MSEIVSTIDRLAPAILESLINATLVGLVLTGAAFFAIRRSTRLSAATRHGLWWVVLGVVVLLPMLWFGSRPASVPDFATTIGSRLAAEAPVASLPAAVDLPPVPRFDRGAHALASSTLQSTVRTKRSKPIRPTPPVTDRRLVTHAAAIASAPAAAASASPAPRITDEITAIAAGLLERSREALAGLQWSPYMISPGSIAGVILVIALSMAVLLLLRLAWGYNRLLWVKRQSRPLPNGLEERLLGVLPEQRFARRILIRQADGITVPTVLGLAHPVILFPSELLDALSESDFENIVLHESAHVYRWDDWTNLLQRVLSALFFFHPAVRVISRQLCLDREIACDDWVIAHTGRTRAYATCLTKLVSLSPWSGPYAPAPGVLKSKSQFARRIESLLDRRRNASPRASRLAFLTAAILLSVMTFQLAKVPPVVAVFDPIESLLRANVPVVSEAAPRRGFARAPVAVTPVGCSEVVYESNRRLFGCENEALAPAATTVRPANLITYVPAVTDNAFAEAVGARGWSLADFFSGSDNSAATYLIQYRNGATDKVSERELLGLLSMGITGDYVREIRQAGLENVTIEDLKSLKHVGIDGNDIEALSDAGLKYLTVEDVVRLQHNGVRAEDVWEYTRHADAPPSVDEIIEMRQRGLAGDFLRSWSSVGPLSLSISDMTKLRNHGVGPEYYEALREAAATIHDIDDIITLRNNGVSAAFAAAALAYVEQDLDIDDIVALRAAGVSEDYLESLNDLGVTGLDAKDIVGLRSNGVDPELVSAVRAYSANPVTIGEVVALRANGVDHVYLEGLEQAGLGAAPLSTDDIVALRANGVDPEFAGAVIARWGSDVSVRDVITLRANGVSTDYLEDLGSVDVSSLSPDDVVALRANGVYADLIASIMDYDFNQAVDVGDIIALRANGVSEDYLAAYSKLDQTFSVSDIISLHANGVEAGFVEGLARLKLGELSAQDIIKLRVMGISSRAADDLRRKNGRSF